MKHFPPETWSDYVRDTAPPSQRAEMRRHLEQGCGACSSHVAALEAVQRLVENERELGLPAGIERSVKARFAGGRAGEGGRRLSAALQLVFDSRLAPAAAIRGVESGAARQLIFTSAELSLDLRLTSASGRVRLLGEVLERESGYLAGAPVALLADGELADQGTTGEFGQFELEAGEGARLKLRLELEERVDLEIPR